MTLAVGTRVGVYEIMSPLGAGGMGEVYRARDARLQRDVALKILPDAFASDAERLARFEREAQMLASLNHPHIAAIYGVEESGGVLALVLELVDGETLAERISQGPLPLDEVIAIARQMAEALEAAHEHGIIHRDLKPSNIKVRSDGTVKVLDFGLAKLAPAPGPVAQASVSALTLSPTITTPAMTQIGMILGTAAYMSPEQAKGREADKRSDVWAFGAVLYEMLTGKRAFDGDDMSDTLASVLKIDPDWARLPADVPAAVRTLIEHCLIKDRRHRVSDLSAAKFVLNAHARLDVIQPAAVTPAVATVSRSRSNWLLPAAVGAVVAAVVVGGIAWGLRAVSQPPVVARFSFTLPEGQDFSSNGRQVFAISHDGTRMVYSANQRLYLRAIGDFEAHPIPGTEADLGAYNPSFAPDGESIAYFSAGRTGGASVLKRIPITGGAGTILANTATPLGANWDASGILFGQGGGAAGAVMRVASNGGTPEPLITLAAGEQAHGPQMLPDGHTVLFTLAKGTGLDRWDHAQVVVQSLVDRSRHVLQDGASDARYLPGGYLIYAVSGTLFAVPFDAQRLALTGNPVPMIAGVRRATGATTGSAHLVVSDTGTVVYRPGPAVDSSGDRNLVIGDDKGATVTLKVRAGDYAHPRVSFDGNMLAVARIDGTASDIWTYDLSGKSEIKRLTFEGNNRYPVWSADRRVTFQSSRESDQGLWRQSPDNGTAERLTKAAQGEEHVPESWSHDSKHLLFSIVKGSKRALWVLTVDGLKVERFGDVESVEPLSATFSPDDKWVAYTRAPTAGALSSPDRGVFVEPFPPTGLKRQAPKVVIDYHPVWSPDGSRIFFVAVASRATMAVSISTRPSVAFGAPADLAWAPRPALLSGNVRGYDVLRDGRVVSLSAGADASPSTEVRVILNWFEELKRLAPVK